AAPALAELQLGVDGAEDLAPHLLGGLHLARDLVGPVVRHVAVRAGGAHARAVAVVDGGLEFLVDVVTHLVAADAELLGVGDLQGGVEAAPEHDAGDEPAQGQEAQAEVDAGRAQGAPPGFQPPSRAPPPAHWRCSISCRSRVSMSTNSLATSGVASVCTTWHCMQK